ncbi:restriction endonuclease subunit S [Bacteroides thetaiotaomicron]|uniref:Type I restriction enzyme MjaXP specificity protein n=1 Tax=Bacteroides thetaiotaomicron (strain ATCC 29148 / DSM 2079 / JCM 5827 / CCUG 10774 / NCTC 10582 / VPI-5482 / E50) TaxID=226186 RepID=Q89Z37_BACTN|nr:restriction endonuclease subunit S [Bacteroides thetaiotaomicron]AAO79645.1 putative Type I restriction enzyme MjaXP specificity protein [Bacteroides thetaiotaomicron VPI-5482]MDC7299026.1 restriction endonuclease subunit S [Bacteroides thetaiotaomicron]PQL40650.1 restriction endonuclease subunit S [Bacteroides thetaiotaomicron]UML59245.1 restriction endonuclease subunit S [Bacteroides thetaiotaomicron]
MAIDNKDKKVLKSSIEREQNELACSAEREKIKGSKNLNVPHLRFPEFSGEWNKYTINDLATVVGGGTPDTTVKSYWGGDIQWFTPSEIGKNKYVDFSKRTITRDGLDNSSAKLLPLHTILLSSRATVGECSIASNECTTNQGFQSLIAKQCNIDFLYYLIQTKKKDLIRNACGSTFLEISANEIRKIKVAVPVQNEQEQIAKLLSLIDERIATQNKIIDKLKSLIKGLPHKMAEIGLQKGCWEKVLLSTVLVERKELNSELYTVHSVSVSEGVINQIEYLGRSFAAKDTSNYHVARYGDIIYTKSPTGDFPYGIVKQSYIEQPVAISPLYGVYSPTSFETGVYLHYYFMSSVLAKNYLYPLIQKGAKNTINISNQRFLENRIALPLKQTDRHNIARALITIQKKLDIEKCAMDSLTKQRSYLLQQLFI